MQWWDFEWVCPANLYDLTCGWFSNKFKNVEKGWWEMCFFAVLWAIWLDGNEIIFTGKNLDVAWLRFKSIKTLVALWTTQDLILRITPLRTSQEVLVE